MRVRHLLVDEIVELDREKLAVVSTHFAFGERSWISPHAGVEGSPVGPFTMIGQPDPIETPTVGMHRLATRPLPFADASSGSAVFSSRWSVEAETVYTTVLPQGFVASDVELPRYETSGPPFQLAGTAEGRLFFHTLFMGMDSFDVRAEIRRDPEAAREAASTADARAGERAYERFGSALERDAVRPEFWLRLLELGSTLFK